MDKKEVRVILFAVLAAEAEARLRASQIEHLEKLEQDLDAPGSYKELKQELASKIKSHKQAYRKAQAIIDSLTVRDAQGVDHERTRACKTILAEHYLNGKTWQDIATIIHFSDRQTMRLHGVALENLAKPAPKRRTKKAEQP